MTTEYEDLMHVALADVLTVAALEGELVIFPRDCVVDTEAAASVFFLAQAGCTAIQAGLHMQSIEGWRVD